MQLIVPPLQHDDCLQPMECGRLILPAQEGKKEEAAKGINVRYNQPKSVNEMIESLTGGAGLGAGVTDFFLTAIFFLYIY